MHLAVELGTLPGWVGLGAALNVGRGPLVIFAGAYVAASLFLSPDLDLERSSAAYRWRKARVLWKPYAALFRHRGISHSPVWGPLTRILYLGGLAALGWALLNAATRAPPPRSLPWESALPILAGVYLPHLLHVALDRVTTWGRRPVR